MRSARVQVKNSLHCPAEDRAQIDCKLIVNDSLYMKYTYCQLTNKYVCGILKIQLINYINFYLIDHATYDKNLLLKKEILLVKVPLLATIVSLEMS